MDSVQIHILLFPARLNWIILYLMYVFFKWRNIFDGSSKNFLKLEQGSSIEFMIIGTNFFFNSGKIVGQVAGCLIENWLRNRLSNCWTQNKSYNQCKRPRGHISHLRNSSNQFNTFPQSYDYTIRLNKRKKTLISPY